MRFTESSNPVLSEKRFQNIQMLESEASGIMTLSGTINKTLILFFLLLISSILTWKVVAFSSVGFFPLVIVGAVGGLVLAIVTAMKPQYSAYTAPAYVLFEGLFVGAISAYYESFFSGIVFKAIGITFSILFITLVLYKTGIIKATPKFKKGIIIATAGIAFFYILNLIFSFFGGGVSLFNLGLLGIGIQLFIVVIAALNFVLDFDNIEKNIDAGMPKYIEWYAGFGIMVTLIWLYIEILRLIALLSNRN